MGSVFISCVFLCGYVLTKYKNTDTPNYLLGQRALSLLANERLVDVRDDASSSNRGLDQRVQLLVSPDGKLEMPGGDPLHLQVLGGVAGQLKHLSSEVLEDGGAVDGRGGSNPPGGERAALEVAMDPSNEELEYSPGAPGDRLLFHLARVLSCLASSHLRRFRFKASVSTDEFKLPM